jgi:ParB/RepB/Spo0J family partition protein
MAPKRGSESLLDEMTLDQAEFTSLGQASVGESRKGRLDRTYMTIPIKAIEADSPFQTRLVTFDPDEVPEDAELLESVRRHGVLEPIYVERLPAKLGVPSSYQLIAGHRRLAAARAAQMEHVPGIIANQDDDLQALNLAENSGHRQLLPYEKAIALVERRKREPGLSLRKLAKATGIPFGTTSDLVAAYEKSPPALRKLFAEGVAARTIIELQAVFDDLDDESQVASAKALGGASIGQAQTFRQLVEQGIEPEAAARSAVGFAKPAHKDPHDTASQTRSQRKQSSPHKKRPGKPASILHPDDEAGLEALCARTGVKLQSARRLTRKAFESEADYESLTFASTFVARGGKQKIALEIASRAANERRVAGAIRAHIRQLERARALIVRQEDAELGDFIRTIFFGA